MYSTSPDDQPDSTPPESSSLNGQTADNTVEQKPTTSAETDKTKRKTINTNIYKRELKKLNHSILIAYLDLLEILVKAPNTQIQIEQTIESTPANENGGASAEQPQEPVTTTTTIIKTLREQKLEDIELLFINMHHLINELRPHQARDNIRCILEMQKQQRAETAQKFKTHLYKIVDLLKICIQSIQTSASLSNGSSKANIFLEELVSLKTNAYQLSKCLDKFDSGSAGKHLNGYSTDVEMKESGSSGGDGLLSLSKESSSKQLKSGGSKLAKLANGVDRLEQQYESCEFKDLILCDLIDEYLKKENEF